MPSGEDPGEQGEKGAFRRVGDEHHLDEAVGEVGVRGEPHPAAVVGRVRRRHRVSIQLTGRRVVHGDGEPHRPPGGERPQRRIGVDVASAQQPDPVGDHLDVGVVADAGDTQIRSPVHLGQIDTQLTRPREARRHPERIIWQPQPPDEVVAPTARQDGQHPTQAGHRARDRPGQAVPAERDHHASRRCRPRRQFAGVRQIPRRRDPHIRRPPGEFGAHRRQQPQRPAPPRTRIDDDGQPPTIHHRASFPHRRTADRRTAAPPPR